MVCVMCGEEWEEIVNTGGNEVGGGLDDVLIKEAGLR